MTNASATYSAIIDRIAAGDREVYHAPSDMFVAVLSINAHTAMIAHPYKGTIIVPADEVERF